MNRENRAAGLRLILPLLIWAGTVIPPDSAGAQDRPRIIVYPFASEDGRGAAIVTEILRVGIASSGYFEVLDPSALERKSAEDTAASAAFGSADFSLEGSVGPKENGILVAYRLLESATGRILEAQSATLRSESLEQDASSLAASLGNLMLASYAGSNPRNIELLIRLGRYDEAGRRLDAYEARNPGAEEIHRLRDAVSSGRAELWLDTARREAEASRKLKGLAALETARNARDSAEAALMYIPPEDRRFQDSAAVFLAGPAASTLARGRTEARKEILGRARTALRSGQPLLALSIMDDFLSTEGPEMLDRPLADLAERARAAQAKVLASKARALASQGDYVLATSLIREAADLSPGLRKVRTAADRIGRAEAGSLAEGRVREALAFEGVPEVVFAWAVSAGPALGGFECADFRLPLSGVFPGMEASLAKYFRTSEGLGGALRIGAFAAGGSQGVVTRTFPGSLDAALGVLDAGAEVYLGPGVPRAGRFEGGFGLDAGFVFATYRADYQDPGIDPVPRDWTIAPTARISAFVGFQISPEVSLRLSGGYAGAWFFGFGPAGGLRTSLTARYSRR